MNTDTAYTMRGCGFRGCAPCTMKNYEGREIDFVTGYLDRVAEAGKLNGVFVDVGAHVGLWSLSMSEWYQCRYAIIPIIYALECESGNYVKLRANAQQAKTGIIPLQIAAWDKDEWVVIRMNENPGRHNVTNIVRQDVTSMRVQAKQLDSLTQSPENRQIDVLKLDVEGAELNVLRGARKILDENDQLLVMAEYSIPHFAQYGYTPVQITGFMQTIGYRPVRPEDKTIVETIGVKDLKRVMFVKGDIA